MIHDRIEIESSLLSLYLDHETASINTSPPDAVSFVSYNALHSMWSYYLPLKNDIIDEHPLRKRESFFCLRLILGSDPPRIFFRHFYILPWNNGSIPWNNMDQFFTENFIVILNFTASNTDFSDVSSFSCYVEIPITGVRFSSPPPSKTAYFRRFNCFT